MERKGGKSDSKGLEVVGEQHIHCSRVAYGLDHKEKESDQDRCTRDSLVLGDSDHLLCHGNRLFHAGHPCHH